MSNKHHGGPAPVPPGNKPTAGPAFPGKSDDEQPDATAGDAFQDQDAKRRLGDYGGAGEHPRQQPTSLNDGTKHSK